MNASMNEKLDKIRSQLGLQEASGDVQIMNSGTMKAHVSEWQYVEKALAHLKSAATSKYDSPSGRAAAQAGLLNAVSGPLGWLLSLTDSSTSGFTQKLTSLMRSLAQALEQEGKKQQSAAAEKEMAAAGTRPERGSVSRRESIERMWELVEGRPTGTAAVPMTGIELMRTLDRCYYSLPMNMPVGLGNGPNCAPAVLIDALEKLDYDKADLAVLRGYFKKCEEIDAMRSKASRALQNLREEGAGGPNVGAETAAKAAY